MEQPGFQSFGIVRGHTICTFVACPSVSHAFIILCTYQVDPELLAVAVDLVGLGVADGGEVDGPRGVDAAGVDHQLQGLQRQRRVLPLRAEKLSKLMSQDS